MTSSSNAFGSTTFGTSTFSGTRPSVRRRDSREMKGFGAHRGIPTAGTQFSLLFSFLFFRQFPTFRILIFILLEKRSSGGDLVPEHKPNPMEMTMTLSDLDTVQSPSTQLVSDDDPTSVSSPRGKAGFGLDSLFKKKKPEKPGEQKAGLTKISSVITGKNKGPPKDNKALSKEGALKLQLEQQEERRRREQEYARQLEAIKAAPGNFPSSSSS